MDGDDFLYRHPLGAVFVGIFVTGCLDMPEPAPEAALQDEAPAAQSLLVAASVAP